ncbi:MAG: hypothetical protein V7L30_33325, partial [Nostoc sp.]|uniref:hypothetical protein n=1 Tax=Nostoc sp. TaxID=1180 RepID=UPI002FF49415
TIVWFESISFLTQQLYLEIQTKYYITKNFCKSSLVSVLLYSYGIYLKTDLYTINKFLQFGTRIFHEFGVSC